jgi:hypothetical protein
LALHLREGLELRRSLGATCANGLPLSDGDEEAEHVANERIRIARLIHSDAKASIARVEARLHACQSEKGTVGQESGVRVSRVLLREYIIGRLVTSRRREIVQGSLLLVH